MPPKVSYIVTDMEFAAVMNINDETREFSSERQALKEAQKLLAASCGDDSEVWVWRLSHVLSKPTVDPVIDKVRA